MSGVRKKRGGGTNANILVHIEESARMPAAPRDFPGWRSWQGRLCHCCRMLWLCCNGVIRLDLRQNFRFAGQLHETTLKSTASCTGAVQPDGFA